MEIRELHPEDVEPLVALALRAWEPVFASLRETLGDDLSRRLRPDWRRDQADAVRSVCGQEQGMTVRVADDGDGPVGFVAFAPDHRSSMGVVEMLGVDPAAQGRGAGAALTRRANDELRAAGMAVAMVETGGDPGHAPARRVYEKAGATRLPVARYFTVLDEG